MRRLANHGALLIAAVGFGAAAMSASPARALRLFESVGHVQPVAPNSTEQTPLLHAVGDVDLDGIPDVVVPGLYDSIGLYRGLGDGTFARVELIHLAPSAAFLAIADFDGDGAPDIAHGNSGSVGVLYGDGTGSTWVDVWDLIYPEYFADALVVGDFDEDGRVDLAAPAVGHLLLFLSRPGRTFERRTLSVDSLQRTMTGARVTDLDLDGHADIVVSMDGTGTPHDIVCLFGNGDCTFETRTATVNGGTRGLEVSDVDGDGRPDLLGAAEWFLRIAYGQPGRTFGAPRIVEGSHGIPALSVAAADFDGDGIVDLVTSPGSGLRTYRGLGGRSFATPLTTPAAEAQLWPLVAADLDGDERQDLVAITYSDYSSSLGLLLAFLGDGTGRFGNSRWSTVPLASASGTAAADLDGDGRPDLATVVDVGAPTTLRTWLTRPGRQFSDGPSTALAPTGAWRALGFHELTGDASPDLVLLAPDRRMMVLPGLGAGTFGPPLTTGASASKIVDVDGDGWVDFASGTGTVLRVVRSLGDGTFAPPVDSPMGRSVGEHVFGDIDGDGIADAAFDAGGLWTARGRGDGTFDAPRLRLAADSAPPWAIEDVDGDGRDDLLVTTRSDDDYCATWCRPLNCLLQQPDGGFGPPITSPWAGAAALYSIRDVTGDGARDLLFEGSGGVMLALGDGAGRFRVVGGSYFTSYPSYGDPVVRDLDIDLDGRLDVIGRTESGLAILWGRDPVPPSVALLGPAPLPALVPGASAPIAWSADDDVGVASIDLFVSRHGARGPFARIASGLPDTGAFDWPVAGPLSDSVAFKVVARDSADNVAHATSPTLLRIVDPLDADPVPLPARLALAVAPNPARGRCEVRLALPRAGRVTLALHDLQGRRVATLLDAACEPGERRLAWSPAAPLPAGLYFLRLDAIGERRVARLVIAE